MCSETCLIAHCLGSYGGALFDYFILIHGSEKDSRMVRTCSVRADIEYEHFRVLKSYQSYFWYYAAISLYRANSRCSMPLVHFTLMQEYRGLSRIGKSLTAAYGGAPAINTFDRKKRILMNTYVSDVSQMVAENNGIVAFDNWCNVYGSPNLSTSRDTAYLKANYTVVGVTKYQFIQRPSFMFTMLNPHMALASVPQLVTDLEEFEAQVSHFHS